MYSRRHRLSYISIACVFCLWLLALAILHAKDVQVAFVAKRNSRQYQTNGVEDEWRVVEKRLSSKDKDIHRMGIMLQNKIQKEKLSFPAPPLRKTRSSRHQFMSRLANYETLIGNRNHRLPGEIGQGVTINGSVAEKAKEKAGYEQHAFNQLVSDRISVFRTLQDYRNQQ